MVLVKNVNPLQPGDQALQDVPPADPNPPDIHPPPADRDDAEETDSVEVWLLATVAMAAVLMFSLIISDCLLGVDLPLLMSSRVEELGSYSLQAFQSTPPIFLETIATFHSLLQSAWAMISLSQWSHLLWVTTCNVLTSIKIALVTLWQDYLPIVNSSVIALAATLRTLTAHHIGPFFETVFSSLQNTVNKLLDRGKAGKLFHPGVDAGFFSEE